MAQAARLNLRMQKEIQLLLNDPPHGVSLNLSEDANVLTSLSSIEAKIEGPEETVYANGVFILKIQIPERYPFQPPNVTFATPIYHPNIDNGGRICLDILNLPPKVIDIDGAQDHSSEGAWQPSLNIATVLISIGLLLSEPNPDDGLMAEISREYKYNKQVFDTNARLWTEKYASPAAVGASAWGSIDVGILPQNTQMEDKESLGSLSNASNKNCEGSQRKVRSLGQKLSLKSERSEESTKTTKHDMGTSHLLSTARSTGPTASLSDVSGRQNSTSENMPSTASGEVSDKEYQGNKKNLQLPGQKLSITSEAPCKRSDVNYPLPSHLPTSALNAKDHAMPSSEDILGNNLARSIDGSYKPLQGSRRNIRTLGLKLSLKSVKPEKKSDDQKENMPPNHLSSQSGFNSLKKRSLDVASRKNVSGGPALVQQNSNTESQLPNNPSMSNGECNRSQKKLCLLSRKLSLKSELPGVNSGCDKQYMQPACNQSGKKPNELPPSAPGPKSETVAMSELPLSAPILKTQATTPGSAGSQKDANPSNCSVKQNQAAMENIVVSDSEDSADECERPPRSRLSLMRRRLAGRLRS